MESLNEQTIKSLHIDNKITTNKVFKQCYTWESVDIESTLLYQSFLLASNINI